jgi:hypothetical protein
LIGCSDNTRLRLSQAAKPDEAASLAEEVEPCSGTPSKRSHRPAALA